MRTITDCIAVALSDAGVKRIFGVVGDPVNGFSDAFRCQKSIDWVHVLKEEGAAFAAAAEAHFTGALAVCAGSCGPEDLHLVDGIAEARRSGVPMLAIAAQTASADDGVESAQVMYPATLFGECAHHVEFVRSAEQLPQTLARAIKVAVEQGGVAVVVISSRFLSQNLASATPMHLHGPSLAASHAEAGRPGASFVEFARKAAASSATQLKDGPGKSIRWNAMLPSCRRHASRLTHILRAMVQPTSLNSPFRPAESDIRLRSAFARIPRN